MPYYYLLRLPYRNMTFRRIGYLISYYGWFNSVYLLLPLWHTYVCGGWWERVTCHNEYCSSYYCLDLGRDAVPWSGSLWVSLHKVLLLFIGGGDYGLYPPTPYLMLYPWKGEQAQPWPLNTWAAAICNGPGWYPNISILLKVRMMGWRHLMCSQCKPVLLLLVIR